MSEHPRPDERGAGDEAPHGDAHPHVEAAEPDRASYPWLMTVVAVFLTMHLVGLVVLWLWFQRQSEDAVQSQVLSKENQALLQLRDREQVELTSYGVVDRAQGLYRVPIERGVDLYLEGVRARAASGEPMRIGPPVPGAPPAGAPIPGAPAPGGASPGATVPPAGAAPAPSSGTTPAPAPAPGPVPTSPPGGGT